MTEPKLLVYVENEMKPNGEPWLGVVDQAAQQVTDTNDT